MSLEKLNEKLQSSPETIEFADVMAVIEQHYDYTPQRFSNGPAVVNEAGSNEGSCKLFALGQLLKLTEAQTLACFGKYYRQDVLGNPEGDDHGNIRSFMNSGWAGINFDGVALTAKEASGK